MNTKFQNEDSSFWSQNRTKLTVPHPSQIRLVKARIKFIEEQKIESVFDLASLFENGQSLKEQNPTKYNQILHKHVELAKINSKITKKFQITHLERVAMVLCLDLLSISQKPQVEIRNLYSIISPDAHTCDLNVIILYFQDMQKELTLLLKPIRAKLAYLEILASLEPDIFFPTLIEHSIEYMQSNYFTIWLMETQNKFRFGSKKEQDNAKKTLKRLYTAISGNRFNLRENKLNKYYIGIEYYRLRQEVENTRESNNTKDNISVFANNLSERLKLEKSFVLQELTNSHVSPSESSLSMLSTSLNLPESAIKQSVTLVRSEFECKIFKDLTLAKSNIFPYFLAYANASLKFRHGIYGGDLFSVLNLIDL